jgi:hypothetical protein
VGWGAQFKKYWPGHLLARGIIIDHNSRIRVSSILVLVVQVTTRIRRRRIFFLQVALRKKGKNQVPTSYLEDPPSSFFVLRVAQFKKAKDFCSDELHTRAHTWKPLSPPGLVCRRKEKKRERPRKVDCRHKKGTRERRKKKRKRPRKARRWLPRRHGSVCPKPRISFFGS